MTDDDLFGDDDALDPETALNHMHDPTVHKWEGTLLTMLQAVRAALKRKRLDDDAVERLAPSVVLGLCEALGGSVGYIPRGQVVKRAIRDTRMYADWCGTPSVQGMAPPELARKYHMAVQTCYEIIARQRALHRRMEPDLFGYDEGDKE